jgi:hypothetical protein
MADLSGAVPTQTPLQELVTLLVAELKKQVAAELPSVEAKVADDVKKVEAVLLKRCCGIGPI